MSASVRASTQFHCFTVLLTCVICNANIQSQIIERWGYTAEVHEVTTEDGYILTLQRIPHGKNGPGDGSQRKVVFLQHGLEGASSNWVINLPHQSLGKKHVKPWNTKICP